MGLLKASSKATKLANLAQLPGVSAGSRAAQDQLRVDAAHGLQGRILRPAMVGNRAQGLQGPRAYAPRLSKPST